jgi:chorismate dehydratase
MSASAVRLGAVGYLNARPLVYGLERNPRFKVRYDVPSECARLLHEGTIDLGLIPSIEYLRGGPYCIVPDLAIASNGPVASVALYTSKSISEVRSIALDTDSRTSVALVKVLCARLFKVQPTFRTHVPDLHAMLQVSDAALVIGDNALFSGQVGQEGQEGQVGQRLRPERAANPASESERGWGPSSEKRGQDTIEKIDLGSAWKQMTGLPFVYAFWAGRPDAIGVPEVSSLREARDVGVTQTGAISRDYFPESPERQAVGEKYLQDNIKYYLREAEQAGLREFYRYAVEVGAVPSTDELRFY